MTGSSTTTADACFVSLTGFDELAIAKHFGAQVHKMHPDSDTGSPFGFLRALIFVDLRRRNFTDKEAYAGAMEMGIGDVQEYFAEEQPELDPDDPDTEAGKEPTPSD